MTITLSPETQRLLDERLKAGRHASPDEAIRDGLLLLEQQRQEEEVEFRALKAKLERGADQALRGELADGEAVLEAILARKRARAGKPVPA